MCYGALQHILSLLEVVQPLLKCIVQDILSNLCFSHRYEMSEKIDLKLNHLSCIALVKCGRDNVLH